MHTHYTLVHVLSLHILFGVLNNTINKKTIKAKKEVQTHCFTIKMFIFVARTGMPFDSYIYF